MAYKGDTWFRQKGKKTYPRFFLRAAFEEPQEHLQLWEKEIVSKLDSPDKWSSSVNYSETLLSKYSVLYKTTRKFSEAPLLSFEIGLYRGGFHVYMKDPMPTKFSTQNRIKLSEAIFGDPNRTSLWTQEIAKVAPMTNELLKRIRKFCIDEIMIAS